MLSLIQTEVVRNHHWLTSAEFTNVVAISQMTPGPIGINTATYCGYTAVHSMGYGTGMSVLGSAIATFALVLPTFILMILITKMFMRYMKTTAVQSVFEGLRPAVVGLLAAATLMLMNSENFGSFDANRWQICISIALFIATFVWHKGYQDQSHSHDILCRLCWNDAIIVRHLNQKTILFTEND